MSELRWTDQDMINFAGRFSEYEVCEEHLDDYREDVTIEALKKRIEEIVFKVKDNPELLLQIENIINSKK
jgi:hypothetical protein